MAKKATKTISEDGSTIRFEFNDDAVEDLNAEMSTFSEDIVQRLAMHGLSAKMGDSYAGVETVAECRESALRVYDDLAAGNWTTRVAGTSGPRVTQLAEAFARVAQARGKELSLEAAVEAIGAMPDEQKKALRKVPAIRKAIADIKVEKLQKESEAAGEGDDSVLDAIFG
jgi:hypothetical protein